MSNLFFEQSIPSRLEEMPKLVNAAFRAVKDCGWVAGAGEFSLRLCLEEAIVNAIHHGNQDDPQSRVQVQVFDEDRRCRIRVYDEGKGFDVDSIQPPTPEQLGGRGIMLMRYYMKSVEYLEGEHCLELKFDKACLNKGGCCDGR